MRNDSAYDVTHKYLSRNELKLTKYTPIVSMNLANAFDRGKSSK
jgi:hypothetical protein